MKIKMLVTFTACIFLVVCFPVSHGMAQAIDLSKMSPDERKAAQAKIEAASRVDWQNMMNLLGLKTPVLVPQMEDSTRPPNLTQKVAGSGYWFDSAGSQLTRTMWGNWTNYDESKANHYVLPDPLKFKNGKPVSGVKQHCWPACWIQDGRFNRWCSRAGAATRMDIRFMTLSGKYFIFFDSQLPDPRIDRNARQNCQLSIQIDKNSILRQVPAVVSE
jgi:hypothetical protein